MNPAGSVWQKWDLHIHTPASFHWPGKKLEEYAGDTDTLCADIVERFNATDVSAFCIMDYWTFAGYILLREYLDRHATATSTLLLPGIELRMEAPTDYRLNTHVLFSGDVSTDALTHFLSHLKIGGHDGKPPSRQAFIDIARTYDAGKLRKAGLTVADRSDETKMLDLGMKTVLVTRESVQAAIHVVGEDKCLLVQPYDTSGGIEGLDWKSHPYTDSILMKWAHCFETRHPLHVDLFLGLGHPTKPDVGAEFIDNLGGNPKPVFSGSDAHQISKYGVYPSNRITWLKAQATYKGLQQVCHEPTLRCYIGERPPKLVHVDRNPTKYMKSLSLAKVGGSSLDEHWFDGKSLLLNPGLIAIIGNKGSGKSALADILALAGNSHCSRMEFLNEERFRGTGNKSQHFHATLTWADETPVTVGLGQNADTREPERVRYLPQHYIEALCNEITTGNDTSFGKELRKVIFSHVPPENQLGCGTLDELLDYLIVAHRQAFGQVQQTLRGLNEAIVRNEQEISEDTIRAYQKSLALKQGELDALDKVPIAEVQKPPDDPGNTALGEVISQIEMKKQELATLQKQLGDARAERLELTASQATLNRLIGHVENFDQLHREFVAARQGEFRDAGFEINDLVKAAIDKAPLDQELRRVSWDLAESQKIIEGEEAAGGRPATVGLETLTRECQAVIGKLQESLDAPQKAYQAYMKEVEERSVLRASIVGGPDKSGTIEYFKGRLQRATDAIPQELARQLQERRELVRRLHSELLDMRQVYEKLYAPVQGIAAQAATSAHSIQLEFDASVTNTGFESNFLDFIHRGKKGTFYGEEESKVVARNLVRSHNLNSTESVVAFVDAVMASLVPAPVEKGGKRESLTLASQLRDKKKASDLYDYVFGLSYLDIRYSLRLGGKDISQLSPGEKGALLLVFYLLLDPAEIPIIIDQPEHNLDNESVVRLLVECIRKARARRQVMIVTHNPNLAVYCDADQIICCKLDKADKNRIDYSTGGIEDYDINSFAVNVLEGTYPAFDNRRKKWHKPQASR